MTKSTARNAVAAYFAGVWRGISTTYTGMRLTLRYLFKPKTTMRYPEEKPAVPAGHRGIHRYNEEECMLCRACESACPVDCLAIKALGRGKDRMILNFEIDYSKCLFCNLCCEACNPKCLHMSEEYDLSSSERSGCLLDFARRKAASEVEAHQQMLAQKEAERQAAQQRKEKPQAEKKDGSI